MTLSQETICLVRGLCRLLIAILLVPLFAVAYDAKPPSAHFRGNVNLPTSIPPSAHFRERVGAPVPNVNLPASIPADDGKLTIYADFKCAKDGKIPLYLVNRTPKRIMFSSRGHDIHLKLERKNPEGHWERVQFHQDSRYGHGHPLIGLDPGSHFAFSGYLPTKGIKARVRFRSYGSIPLVSNEGEGFFLEEDRLAADLDQMALWQLPNSLQSYFRFDPNRPQLRGNKIPDETFLSALRLVSSYRESAYVRKKAKEYIGAKKDANPEPDTLKITSAVGDILGRQWPATAETESLLKAALKELPDHPIPAWSVLNELLRKRVARNTEEETQFCRRVAEEMKKALERNNGNEIREVAPLIGAPRFAGEYFDDAFLKKWIRSPNDALVRECANALSRRLKFDDLAKIGSELGPDAQLLILGSLARSAPRESGRRSSRNPISEIERHFWINCAREQPIKSVSALYYIGMGNGYNSFNLTLHKPLREFLKREASNPSKGLDGWEVGQVVAFVGAWKRREDIELYRSLLEHPAYQRSEGTKSSRPGVRLEFRRYRVREEARRMLIGMGVPVPEDLVLKEERIIP